MHAKNFKIYCVLTFKTNPLHSANTLQQVKSLLKKVLATIADFLRVRYILLDGYFGNTQTLQMVRDCGLHLISKLRRDAALYLPPTTPYQGRGCPALYGERVNPQEIDDKYRIATSDPRIKGRRYWYYRFLYRYCPYRAAANQ